MSNKVPQIRFNGYSDAWEERKLIDIAGNISDGDWIEANHIFDTGDYRIVQTGNIGIGSFLDKLQNAKYFYQADFDELKANEIFPGDILISRLSDPAGRTSILPDLGVRAVTAVDVAIIRPNDNFHAEFLVAELNSSTILAKVDSLASGSTRKRISRKNLEGVQITLPTFEEQQKIGSFFKQLDDTIALHQRKLDLLKEQKKGYLQKMFPKNGAKVPELRFAGFADDWEDRKFEALLDLQDGIRRGPFGSALKKEFFVENSEYVVYEQQNAIYDNYHTRYKITKEKFDELSKFKVNPGDFIMSGAGTIGRISRVPDGVKMGVFNQALIRFRINPEITDSEYFIQFVRADFMQKNLTGANPGSAITNLVPMSEVKKWEIKVPRLQEQQKIGSFFKQLDNTIALHQRKLDLLKEQKKGFLQKMFV